MLIAATDFLREDKSSLPVQLFPPSKLLESDPCPPAIEQLWSPEEHELVRADFEDEDHLLRSYVEKAKLDHWFEAAVHSAQQAVRHDADQAGEEEALRLVVKEEMSRMENGRLDHEPAEQRDSGSKAHHTDGDMEMEEVGDSSAVGAWIDG